jgi:hypothetical protein
MVAIFLTELDAVFEHVEDPDLPGIFTEGQVVPARLAGAELVDRLAAGVDEDIRRPAGCVTIFRSQPDHTQTLERGVRNPQRFQGQLWMRT